MSHIRVRDLLVTIGHVVRPGCQERPGIDITLVGELTAAIDKRQTALFAAPEGLACQLQTQQAGHKAVSRSHRQRHILTVLFNGLQ